MEITAALVDEQGVRFVVVLVQRAAMQPSRRETTRRSASSLFPGRAVVLCAQDARAVPSYYGRPDIVKFLASIEMERLPWKRYRASAA